MLVVLFIALSPWLSPMKLAAGLNEPWAHLLQGLLTTLGFVVPGALLIALLEKAQSAAGMRPSQRNGDAALSGSAE